MYLLTAAQMKEIDRIAIEERGIPSALLMERAAKAVVREVLALPVFKEKRLETEDFYTKCSRGPKRTKMEAEPADHQTAPQPSAIVYCGTGNNGGDGIAAARFLLREGWRVKCVLVGDREKMTGDSLEMERRLAEWGGCLEGFQPELRREYNSYEVAIDALFGVGLHSELRSDARAAVDMMKSARWVVSVDIPSGIHADTGEVLGDAVAADVTVTFSSGKPGLFVGKGAVHSGRVIVADIGIPADLMDEEACETVVADHPILPRRRRDAHKGDFGKLFILAGDVGYTGAPVLASRAAVRCGAGLVTLAVPEDIYPIVAVKCDEAMVWPWSRSYEDILKKANGGHAVLIGPGLGQGEQAQELVLRLLNDLTCPVILDADGLNILSGHMDVLQKREAVTVLTPHDGEFSRLSGCDLPIYDRLTAAREFAQKYHCILVLKGHRTITSEPCGKCVINSTGNPGMARGGSGDALAGLISGLMVQEGIADPICQAVWLHGRAGDLAAEDKGEYGMSICDMIEQIPYAMKECEEE